MNFNNTTTNKKNINYWKIIIFFVALSPTIYSILTINVLNDWYWHTKIGEFIVNSKTIPKIGIGSWYAMESNLSWTAHEWLSEVVYYLLLGNSETKALIFGKLVALLFSIILICLSLKNVEQHIVESCVLALATSLVSTRYIYARPHIFSYFLLLFTIYCINVTNKKNNWFCLFLFPLSILWGNLHGGSSNLVYIIPVIYIVANVFSFDLYNISFGNKYENKIKIKEKENFFAKITKLPVGKVFVSTMLTFLGLIINPYNIEILLYPYSNMKDDTMLNYIIEWAPPNINNFVGLLMFVTLFLVIFVFINRKESIEKINAYDFLLVVFGTFLFLKSARFFPYFAIMTCIVLPSYTNNERNIKIFTKNKEKELGKIEIKEENENERNIVKEEPNFLISLFDKHKNTILITFVSTFFVCLTMLGFMDMKKEENSILPKVDDIVISEEMIEKIKDIKPKNLYNHYNLGAYLIYKEIPVFIDGRADMYTQDENESFKDFIKLKNDCYFYNPEITIEDIFDKYKFDTFLCTKDEPLNSFFEHNKDKYEFVFEDEICTLYVAK